MKNIRNPIARMLHLATRNRVMGVAKKFNKKKERQKYAKSKLGKDASKQEDV
jgi:hypothetical protein|tara:strand:+ start:5389 stop:5544 length:156 start_codon:yes stop_codon:yes gene_type:complete